MAFSFAGIRSETTLSTTEAIQAYRERMQIEQGHRDWKTHLGVRGLQLKVRQADRLARLLMAFAIAYALVLLLGASQLGKTLREQIEIRRVRPRHGTTRTLSILTLGCALLATPRHLPRAWAKLLQLLDALRSGAGILSFRLAASREPHAAGPAASRLPSGPLRRRRPTGLLPAQDRPGPRSPPFRCGARRLPGSPLGPPSTCTRPGTARIPPVTKWEWASPMRPLTASGATSILSSSVGGESRMYWLVVYDAVIGRDSGQRGVIELLPGAK